MATSSKSKGQTSAQVGNVAPEGSRIWMFASDDAPVRRDGRKGKLAGLALRAPNAAALESLVSQVLSMGTLNHVLRNVARVDDDGQSVPAVYEDNVRVTNRRHVYANGRTVTFDPATGEAKCALYLEPRERADNASPAASKTGPNRDVKVTTVPPEVAALGLDAKTTAAIAALMGQQQS